MPFLLPPSTCNMPSSKVWGRIMPDWLRVQQDRICQMSWRAQLELTAEMRDTSSMLLTMLELDDRCSKTKTAARSLSLLLACCVNTPTLKGDGS